MITITINNAEQLVQREKGWFVANVVGAFVALEPRVEAVIIEKLRASLASEGVEATIKQCESSPHHEDKCPPAQSPA